MLISHELLKLWPFLYFSKKNKIGSATLSYELELVARPTPRPPLGDSTRDPLWRGGISSATPVDQRANVGGVAEQKWGGCVSNPPKQNLEKTGKTLGYTKLGKT